MAKSKKLKEIKKRYEDFDPEIHRIGDLMEDLSDLIAYAEAMEEHVSMISGGFSFDAYAEDVELNPDDYSKSDEDD